MRSAKVAGLGLTAVSTFMLLGVHAVSALDNPEQVSEETCAREWSHNPRMRAACIEQQKSVLEKARSTPIDPRLQQEDLSLIQERCEKNWPDDVCGSNANNKRYERFKNCKVLRPKASA
jgi:hypothetical protein